MDQYKVSNMDQAQLFVIEFIRDMISEYAKRLEDLHDQLPQDHKYRTGVARLALDYIKTYANAHCDKNFNFSYSAVMVYMNLIKTEINDLEALVERTDRVASMKKVYLDTTL